MRSFYVVLLASAVLLGCGYPKQPPMDNLPSQALESLSGSISVDNSTFFGRQLIGQGHEQSVIIHNHGDSPLHITALEVSEGFVLPSAATQQLTLDTPAVIPAGRKSQVRVRFTPQQASVFNGELRLTLDNTRQQLSIPLRGIGVAVAKPATAS